MSGLQRAVLSCAACRGAAPVHRFLKGIFRPFDYFFRVRWPWRRVSGDRRSLLPRRVLWWGRGVVAVGEVALGCCGGALGLVPPPPESRRPPGALRPCGGAGLLPGAPAPAACGCQARGSAAGLGRAPRRRDPLPWQRSLLPCGVSLCFHLCVF